MDPRCSPAVPRPCSFTRCWDTGWKVIGSAERKKARPSRRRSIQQVLPEFLSVIDDPTRRTLNGVDSGGWYDV